MKCPRAAYVLLWFPEPTETFIFREVAGLWDLGVELSVFTLYGELTKGIAPEMMAVSHKMERQGIKSIPGIPKEIFYWWKRDPALVKNLFKSVMLRRWKGLEKGGESLWGFLCGFRLGRRFVEEGIEHAHSPWATGPATAAWVGAHLAGIPFSFTARAWDIYPEDGALKDKINAAAFVRCNTAVNLSYLRRVGEIENTPDAEKVKLVYNGISLNADVESGVAMSPPYKLFALGRFVGKKGYEYLLEACSILKKQGLELQLTLAGAGPREKKFKRMVKELDIEAEVDFPGFIEYDQVSAKFQQADVFVMPSVIDASGDRDGIPNVIMESFAHRVPVVATDVSGISEVVEHGVTGLLAPEKDAQALAEALKTMLSDRDDALRMAAAGKKRVFEMFDQQKSYENIRDLLIEYTP